MPCLADAIGQDRLVGEFQTELERNRLNHAYLFEGLHGSGRLTLARGLAARVLCETPTRDACGVCKACKMMAAGTHPDYLELPREDRELKIRRFAERAGSDGDTLEHPPVLTFLHMKPLMASSRVCVIPDAERMQASAANAFLKTLEEPPAGRLILLTTAARDRLPGTILSRCRRVGVAPLPAETIRAELETRTEIPYDMQDDLATLAEGSLGLALQLAEGDAVEDWQWIKDALRNQTPGGAIRLAQGLIDRAPKGKGHDQRQAALRILDLLALCLRRQLRDGESPRAIALGLDAIWSAAEQLGANVSPDMVLRTAALNIISALRRG